MFSDDFLSTQEAYVYVVIARSRISSSHADTHSRAALGRSLLSLPSSINHSSIIVASIRPSTIATHTRYGTHITSSAHQSCSSSRSSPLALCRVTQPSSHTARRRLSCDAASLAASASARLRRAAA